MPHSTRSSNVSAPCRLEWRPSRWLVGLLALIACLAADSAIASDLPRPVAWPLALVALGHGLRLAWREQGQSARALVIAEGANANIDGVRVEDFSVHWRGPLAFARWQDATGAVHRLAWWPDTLPAAARRELRLAAPAPLNAPSAHSVAP